MKVALFGGTGFVGTHITEELINNHHDPVLLVRPGSENKVYLPDKCHVNIGDIAFTIKGSSRSFSSIPFRMANLIFNAKSWEYFLVRKLQSLLNVILNTGLKTSLYGIVI